MVNIDEVTCQNGRFILNSIFAVEVSVSDFNECLCVCVCVCVCREYCLVALFLMFGGLAETEFRQSQMFCFCLESNDLAGPEFNYRSVFYVT